MIHALAHGCKHAHTCVLWLLRPSASKGAHLVTTRPMLKVHPCQGPEFLVSNRFFQRPARPAGGHLAALPLDFGGKHPKPHTPQALTQFSLLGALPAFLASSEEQTQDPNGLPSSPEINAGVCSHSRFPTVCLPLDRRFSKCSCWRGGLGECQEAPREFCTGRGASCASHPPLL